VKSSTKAALITAAIGGLFTVGTGLLTYWLTTREPELSYTLSVSPSVLSSSGPKRIVVLEVRNTGRKEIEGALIEVAVPGGQLDESAFAASPGVKINESRSSTALSLTADLLNPQDSVKASVLFTSNGANVGPQVTVRAPGVRGKEIKLGAASDKRSFLGILPILVAALASVLSLITARSKTVQNRLGLRIAAASASSLTQRELVAFILGECGLLEDADRIRFSSADVSYRGVADHLVHLTRGSAPDKQERITTCLKAIAIYTAVAPKSFVVLREAIVELSGTDLTPEQLEYVNTSAFREGENPSRWRAVVRKFVRSESALVGS